MRKIIAYCAVSLNGKIARLDGSVDWLDAVPNPEESDYGYASFYSGIDTTIMGYTTYAQVMNWGVDFPYPDKTNYVITRKRDLAPAEFVTFISNDHLAFIRALKQRPGKNIWLVGGGQVNTMLLIENLIDELHLHIMPVILEDGIDLFEGKSDEHQLNLIHSKMYISGVMELHYEFNGQ